MPRGRRWQIHLPILREFCPEPAHGPSKSVLGRAVKKVVEMIIEDECQLAGVAAARGDMIDSVIRRRVVVVV